ncbi:dTDP-4-amino-4,6-dideoxygalactose transaminase [Desulfonatronovibrio magnus]|uniref:dTDP-4-amino-4,6-dideoxygalactose transaminase n=1 Tax=Desulfonatronovibrio magnus TaxID=698827 RepID=UPI0005EACF9D|nr:dTDP-4-amino-4,6-dideoxygalactose transaminase [Desulfonatronovibrio magnus]
MQSIPFNKPFIAGKELYYIAQAVLSHSRISGDGPFTKKCQDWLEQTLGTPKALLTHSCTAALEMSALLCDIQPGDEVIMPSFTFVSTANAFVLRGGVPVFVDIRPDTLNMDETLITQALTSRTKAIVPVHYAGSACEMDTIMDIARNHNLRVIEDAAQGLLSTHQNKYLGTVGDLGCLSFHETKNIISGEGGALIINDPELIERAEMIWEKGTNRKKFFRGEVDKYTWVDIGSSYLPSDITAAFLYAQLEMAEKIISVRRKLLKMYMQNLQPLAEHGLIRLPSQSLQSCCNGHIMYIIVRSLKERTDLINRLNQKCIKAVFHYVPLHSSFMGTKVCRIAGSMDNTEALSDRVLRLPMFYEMTFKQVSCVTDAIAEFYRCF